MQDDPLPVNLVLNIGAKAVQLKKDKNTFRDFIDVTLEFQEKSGGPICKKLFRVDAAQMELFREGLGRIARPTRSPPTGSETLQ